MASHAQPLIMSRFGRCDSHLVVLNIAHLDGIQTVAREVPIITHTCASPSLVIQVCISSN